MKTRLITQVEDGFIMKKVYKNYSFKFILNFNLIQLHINNFYQLNYYYYYSVTSHLLSFKSDNTYMFLTIQFTSLVFTVNIHFH